jgi:hypothetical protein
LGAGTFLAYGGFLLFVNDPSGIQSLSYLSLIPIGGLVTLTGCIVSSVYKSKKIRRGRKIAEIYNAD